MIVVLFALLAGRVVLYSSHYFVVKVGHMDKSSPTVTGFDGDVVRYPFPLNLHRLVLTFRLLCKCLYVAANGV